MARRSMIVASSPATGTPGKRQQPSSALPTPARTSKRLKSAEKPSAASASKSTPKKSQYFESEPSECEESASEAEISESGYEDEDASVAADESESEVEEEPEDETEDEKPRKRGRGRPLASAGKTKSKTVKDGDDELTVTIRTSGKGDELWRPGVKTGLGPGKQVFIKVPKARSPGRTPYEDGTIHPNTMAFLADLKKNNDREWMKMHDADYRTSKKDWDTFVESLTEKIIEKDETIPELPAKDLTFRIYRDIRFSNDSTPYKPHFSAAWSRTGRKGPYAAYYLQVEPDGSSFIGSGLWMPDAAPLALLRRNVDRKSHKIKDVLTDARIRKEIYDGIPNDEKKVVKAFVGRNQESALKTKPKGYEADNKNIDLLRLRNYTMGKKLKDDEVLGPKALNRIADLIGVMTPFVTYLNSVVMPDDEASTDDDDSDHDEESTS